MLFYNILYCTHDIYRKCGVHMNMCSGEVYSYVVHRLWLIELPHSYTRTDIQGFLLNGCRKLSFDLHAIQL